MEWTEFFNALWQALLPVLVTAITGIVGWAATKIKIAYESKVQNDVVRKLIEDTVKYVQQVYKDLDGPAKLDKAVAQVSEILQSKNINITEAEIKMLIESSVYTVKKTFEKTTEVEANNVKKLEEGK